jgi:hypothetical protein
MNERRTAAEDAHKPPKITRQSPPPALYVHKARRLPISLCLSFTFPLALHLSPSLNQSIACRRRLIISEGGNYNNNRRVYSHLSLVFFLFHLPPNNARLSLSLSLSLSPSPTRFAYRAQPHTEGESHAYACFHLCLKGNLHCPRVGAAVISALVGTCVACKHQSSGLAAGFRQEQKRRIVVAKRDTTS